MVESRHVDGSLVAAGDCLVDGMGLMHDDIKEFMTPAEVAALLRLHVKTVYRYLETGDIPNKRIGRSWRIRREDVLKLTKPNGEGN